eukprot:TRINITY_DN12928_c0_g1_i1.p1 TRINITY_DN12928_c0_g1~~TRINITY_DN12928_c0_g1_i1.p1  ORF type:complete len:464 (-),score=98.26 TRINITY_DN12928_c0_g1_i1:65-1456(-)
MERDLDVVVFGASGDTGIIGCCCLFFKGRRLGLSSWAPAARNLDKLKKELLDRLESQELGPEGLAPEAPICADASDYSSLLRMCQRAKCVLACAGPYEEYGEGVVKACVEAGTHYVDVTGEVPWVEKMMNKYNEGAKEKKLTIVNCAGYDSVPPDLSTFLAAKSLEKQGGQLQRFDAFVGGGGGAFPTGTLNTVVLGIDKAKQQVLSKATFGILGRKPQSSTDAASRAGDQQQSLLRKDAKAAKTKYVPAAEQANLSRNLFWTMVPGYSALAKQFCLPHFMAAINVNAVHRTAAAEGYGGMIYRERMGGLPSGPACLYGLVPTLMGVGGGLLFALLVPVPYFTTALLKIRDTFNPPLQQKVRDAAVNGFRQTGTTTVRGFGISQDGNVTVQVKLDSDYDPGLGFTMLSACTVAARLSSNSRGTSQLRPGFNTAVSAVGGEVLAEALRHMGVTIEVSTQQSSRL